MKSNSGKGLTDQGDNSEEFYELGKKFEFGTETKKDLDKAIFYYTKSARKGHMNAQFALSVIAANESNIEEAVYWWKKATKNGHGQAKYNLIVSYLNGVGVEKDVNMAFDLMHQGVAEGNGKIGYLLAREYYQGKNISRNFELAAKYYLDSAKSGIHNSMNDLSMMYSMGQIGGKTMPTIAYGLATIALNQGFDGAERTIKAIENTYKLGDKAKQEGLKLAKSLLSSSKK